MIDLAIGDLRLRVQPAGSKRAWENFCTRAASGTPYCRAIEMGWLGGAVSRHPALVADARHRLEP